MKIDIISVIPDLLQSPFAHSIMKRARDKQLLEVTVINLREYTTYARAQVDDYAFGGGAGMVMMIEPLVNAIESLQKKTNLILLLNCLRQKRAPAHVSVITDRILIYYFFLSLIMRIFCINHLYLYHLYLYHPNYI